MSIKSSLYTHHLRVHNMDPVTVSEPDLAVYLDHAPDGVVRPPEVQQVVVPQVPLALLVPLEDGHGPVSQSCQHTALHMTENILWDE